MQTYLTFPRLVFWLLLTASILAAASCSSGEPSRPRSELPPAQEALDNARVAMADAPQFQFELEHPRGTTTLEGGLGLRRAEGSVIAPSRLSVLAEADLGRVFVRVKAVVIDGQTWMTNPLTGNWASIAPADSPFSFLDPVRLVTNVLDQTTQPAYPENGAISDGRIVLNGRVPSEALEPLVGTIIPGVVLDVVLTLDAESFLLRSARLTGKLQPADQPDFVRLITFSGFDADLVIEPPI